MIRLLIPAALACAALPLLVTSAAPAVPATRAPALAAPASAEPACPTFPGADAFVGRIDNRYLPLIPGTTYIYKGTEDNAVQHDVVEVTAETKTILGVDAVVVRDRVTDKHGHLLEDTLDWFAQDADGNVWYMGEDSKAYENGQVVSTEGSWEAGVDGAQPGIVMEAHPHVGDVYSQECAPGVAEDQAKNLDLNASVKTPFGKVGHALRTRETTPLEPGTAEDKYYAQCVGLVRSVDVQGGNAESSLVSIKNGPSPSELGCKGSQGQHGQHGRHEHDRHHDRHHRHGRHHA